MIEESPIVKNTRRVRHAISEQFDNDPDKYIDYLMSQKTEPEKKHTDYAPNNIPLAPENRFQPG